MFTLKPDKFEAKGDECRLVSSTPYLRLGCGEGTLYLQRGAYYYENGEAADPLPQWAVSAVKELSADVLKSVGFEPVIEIPSGRTCPKCNATVEPRMYLSHMSGHAREEKRVKHGNN